MPPICFATCSLRDTDTQCKPTDTVTRNTCACQVCFCPEDVTVSGEICAFCRVGCRYEDNDKKEDEDEDKQEKN